ncbi:hypothetical protein ALP08_04216 [Pseudomonas syringae pv. pisi]|uniref:Tyr recombinase domain-containing protein n=2 Tax=Pseudomonas syringae group TaxID=136849 RepID=A0A3M6DJT1_PSESJ|nr:hypothetical protein ALQ44_03366 [Pseudomonas syringae pv. pisi]RMV55911.1 hypothetical protein ALP08_04216 [Pseudomonas syringae pv. pisi]
MFHSVESAYRLCNVRFEMLDGIKLKVVAKNNEIDMFAGADALQRYENGRKINSIKADQSAILNLYRFCEQQGIDIISRVALQKPLRIGEIEALSSWCGFKIDGEPVVAKFYLSRMRGAKRFLIYLWSFYQGKKSHTIEDLQMGNALLKQMKEGFDLYSKKPFAGERKDAVGLTPNLQRKFFSIINPSEDNSQNPWKTNKIRWRNYILLLLMMASGNRKGEMLLLRLNHLQLTGKRKYYDILKSAEVKDYPRAESPAIKTLGVQVELHDDIAALVEYYVTHVRKEFKGWQKSSFVFVSYRDGLPLSVQTPNAILNELVKKHPAFKGLLSPHRLRNTFHDLLNEALDNKHRHMPALSRALLKAPVQESAGGWASGSIMPARYAKGSIQRNVRELQLLIQGHMTEFCPFTGFS